MKKENTVGTFTYFFFKFWACFWEFSDDHAIYLFYQELNYYGRTNFLMNYFLYRDRNNSKYIQIYMG